MHCIQGRRYSSKHGILYPICGSPTFELLLLSLSLSLSLSLPLSLSLSPTPAQSHLQCSTYSTGLPSSSLSAWFSGSLWYGVVSGDDNPTIRTLHATFHHTVSRHKAVLDGNLNTSGGKAPGAPRQPRNPFILLPSSRSYPRLQAGANLLGKA